jgi:galactokinase
MVTENALCSFEAEYGRPPTHIARAPGRVNLVGEHVDYHMLPVMPFAIDRAVYLLFAPAGVTAPGGVSRVRIATAAGEFEAAGKTPGGGRPDALFQADDFQLDGEISRLPAGDWRNYVRAAAQSLVLEQDAATGIDAWVASDLPVAAGLSSSSALVVAVGLALARVNEVVVGRRAFAEQMARAERFTGTRGGGMDQAASLLSREGCVSWIEFDPLGVEHVSFPDDLRVLLADSGEVAEKSGPDQEAYNQRRETGARALERVSSALGRGGATFREILRAVPATEILGAASDHLNPMELSRFSHVVTEWYRVRLARKAVEAGDAAGLGRLLYAAHASLRDDYEVSTPALDLLVAAARNAGALGARLTGAGFGGSVVVLATSETERDVRDALVGATGSESSVLGVRPADGAGVMEL